MAFRSARWRCRQVFFGTPRVKRKWCKCRGLWLHSANVVIHLNMSLKLQKCQQSQSAAQYRVVVLKTLKEKERGQVQVDSAGRRPMMLTTLSVRHSSGPRARRHLPAQSSTGRPTKFAHLSTTLNFWAQFWARYHLRTPTAAVQWQHWALRFRKTIALRTGGRIYFHLSIFNLKMSTVHAMNVWEDELSNLSWSLGSLQYIGTRAATISKHLIGDYVRTLLKKRDADKG
jgi:hypothetical protein